MMRSKRPILLVEDPAANTVVAECAGDEPGLGERVFSATTPETLTYLRTQRVQRPCVVLLTVDEASDDGLATLRMIKQDEQLRSIPVIVLGPSGDSHMVDESFGLGAAGYMVKSPDHIELSSTLRTLYQYWSLSELPK
jgi:CheY-like chemotaxis protein